MQKYGFELLEEREMHEVGGRARLWRHAPSGAQLLSIVNKDENKCFGVNFFTPPANSTGVAHILEHSVLCGSEKYPLKEPFTELLKGSLQTFLNAFTFPDKTCYPVASANLQDFYNLIDVYLDAVFHPQLSEDTFRQEGWHVEAENADAPWTFKGVVYNEMKGVYSSPDSVLAEQTQQAMFPDNLYSLDSGGNPERIPDLTYEDFKDFHRRYYQPGNARFFFWGDDEEDERLRIISDCIGDAGQVADLPEVRLQPKLAEERRRTIPYAAAEGESRAMFTMSWLLPERGNVLEALKMEMLSHILEGLPGSPLRRALMESGLGEDMTGGGLETDLRQMYYSTGLKGIAPADVSRAEDLIIATLTRLADEGIDPKAVEAAVNTAEFALRENNSGRFPQGLAAMLMALSTWNYGGDPLAALAWERPLGEIKAALGRGENIFEEAIRKNFLETHPSVVTLLPDTGLGHARKEAEISRLAEIQAQCGPEHRQAMVEATEKLLASQGTPDSPEDLARIPALGVHDLPLKNRQIPIQALLDGSATFISHDLPTRGVAYISVLLPLTHLPRRLLPVLPLFSRALLECGTKGKDYTELGTEIAAKTGGLAASVVPGARVDTGSPYCYLTVSGSALYDRLGDFFALVREILLEPQQNMEILLQRLTQMLLEAKARLEQTMQVAGHAAVITRINAHYSALGAIAEDMAGISHLQHVNELIERMGRQPESVIGDLQTIGKMILGSCGAIVDFAAEAPVLDRIQMEAEQLLKALPPIPLLKDGEAVASYKPLEKLPAAEAFVTPGQINFVGKGADLYDCGYEYNGSVNVIARWLRLGRLWDEVRVSGGAYGAFCSFERITGSFTCASYRDPNVDRTLSVYDGLAGFIRERALTQKEVEQAIVGAVGAMDAYMLPDAKAAQALAFYLSGLTPEMRQETREQMLGTKPEDFKRFADILDSFAQRGDICVIGGSEAAMAAREHNWHEQNLL